MRVYAFVAIVTLIALPTGGRADRQVVDQDVHVTSGSSPEVWKGAVVIGDGAGIRTVAGDLTIAAATTGTAENGDSCSSDSECGSGNCEGARCCAVECASCYTCSASGTSCEPAADGAACNDLDPTTYADTCDGTGYCQGSPAPTACPDDTECATYEPFGDGSGRCHVSYAARGTPCDDGLACSASSTCDGFGACL